jgi:hypothetical protein
MFKIGFLIQAGAVSKGKGSMAASYWANGLYLSVGRRVLAGPWAFRQPSDFAPTPYFSGIFLALFRTRGWIIFLIEPACERNSRRLPQD